MQFKKEITTTAEDYKELVFFTDYVLRKKPKLIIIGLIFLSIIASLLTIFKVIPPFIGYPAAGVLLLLCLIFPITTSVKAKNGAKYGKVALGAKRTVEFTNTEIKIYGGRTATDVTVPWDLMFAAYETEKSFLLYLRFDSAFVISKSQLSLTESYEVRNELIKRLKNRFFKLCK